MTAGVEAQILTPASFVGEIPCADCPGQRLVLSLRPDGIFLLRRTYQGVADGRDEHFSDLGLWSTSQDGKRIVLRGGTEAPRQLAIQTRARSACSTSRAARSARG